MNRFNYRFSASLLALALTLPSHTLAAENVADAAADAKNPGGALEEVVVTAQKRSENLQVTPISISVLGSEGLKNRHVTSLLDLGDGAIPSLKVAPFYSRPGALIMNVRGIGVLSDSNQPARDQGVGVYVDGVYLGRPQGLGTALYDIESIEVLKGPQGTLFGRNTEGGAVSITTKKPTGEFQLSATAGAGNYDSYKTDLHIDLPKVANVSVKLDGVLSKRDGWVKNPLAGARNFGGYDKRGLHLAVLWEPRANFNALYSYDNSYDASTTLYLQLIKPGSLPLATAATLQPKRASDANVGVPQQPSIGKGSGHRLGLEWNIMDNMTLKSISSYRELSQGQYDNGSASSTMFCAPGACTGFTFSRYSLAKFTQDQFSEELQLVGDLPRIKYLFGALYYRENVEDNAQAFNTAQFTDAAGLNYVTIPLDYSKQRIDRASRVKTTSQGIFGQATYTPPVLSDAFHLTAGGRFTRDDKDGQLFIVNGALPVVNSIAAPRYLNSSWDRFDPLVNLGYDVSKDILVYAKWSTGYKSGGANSRSLFYAPFNPETVEMYEIGAKTEFFQNRARLNVAAYTGTYKDIQLDFSAQYQQIDPVTGKLITTLRTTTETSNSPGTGKLNGVEGDLTFALTDRLTLSGSFAHNIVEIPATINPFRQANGQLITVPIPIYQSYTPENAFGFGLDYDQPLFGATLVAHVDGNYDSGYYANNTDVAYDPVTRAVTVPQPKGDEAFLVNARVAWTDVPLGRGRATFSLWARNLFNEQHLFYKSQSVTAGVTGFYNEPVTYGLEVGIKY
jgi:iron complex outermembrane receptor protein